MLKQIYITILKKLIKKLIKILNGILTNYSNDIPYSMKKWLASYHPNYQIRNLFFKTTGVKIGKDTFINIGVIIIDDRFSKDVEIKIGERVAISPGVIIISSSAPNKSILNKNNYVQNNLIKTQDITIEDDVWIGAGAILLPGIKIGKESIIGAGSVVTENVPERSIVVGIPAKVIRRI